MLMINDVVAAPAVSQSGAGGLSPMLFMGLMLLVFYFFLIRPQSKRAKEQRDLLNSLSKGDEVVTSGGIMGRISKISDEILELAVAEGVAVKVQKQAVTSVLPKGTLKTLDKD